MAAMNDMMSLVDDYTADTTSVGAFAAVFAKTLATQQAFIKKLFSTELTLNEDWENVVYQGDTVSKIKSARFSEDERDLFLDNIVGLIKGFMIEACCVNGNTPDTGYLRGAISCAQGRFNDVASNEIEGRFFYAHNYERSTDPSADWLVKTRGVEMTPFGITWYKCDPSVITGYSSSHMQAYIKLEDGTINGKSRRFLRFSLNPMINDGPETVIFDAAKGFPELLVVNKKNNESAHIPRARLDGTTLYLDF